MMDEPLALPRIRCSIAVILVAVFAATWRADALGASAAPSATTASESRVQDADRPTNTMCPVTTDESIDPDVFTEYEGERIYFCCRRCLRQFERNPQEYVVNLAAFMSQDEHVHEDEEDTHDLDDLQAGDATNAEHSHDQDEAHEHNGADDHAHADADGGHDEQTAASNHDHEHDHGSELPAFLQWLGNFHPPSVNFPVGLLVAAALAELLLIVTRRSWFASAARFCIWIGALGAIVAASLGWLFGGIQLTDSDGIMTTHRWLGTSTAILALIVLGLSESHHRQPDAPARTRLYRGALFLSAALVSATGFFGGAMIYGIDHYAW